MTVARFPQLAHWGAFTALVEDGRVIGCEPFARDPAPSDMLEAIPAMVHSPLRIARPAIREGWREGKGAHRRRQLPRSVLGRGARRRRRRDRARARDVRQHRDLRRILRLVVGGPRASCPQSAAAILVPRRRLRRPGRKLQLRRGAISLAARDRHVPADRARPRSGHRSSSTHG